MRKLACLAKAQRALKMQRELTQRFDELKLFWLNAEGKREPYGTVLPGGSRTQGTLATHVWLLVDPDGKAVALFVARPQRGVATVK